MPFVDAGEEPDGSELAGGLGGGVSSRSGTVTAGPREIVRFTGDPVGSTVPAGEFWSITIPALNGLATRVTVPTTSPDPARWPATSPSSTPITGGTLVVGTTRRTITFALVAERNV